MEKIEKLKNINLKTMTEQLIDSLEANIVDEMILNSFIRNIEIILKSKEKIVIATKNKDALNVINENYKEIIKSAIYNIIHENIDVSFVVSGSLHEKKDEIKSKNISLKYTFYNYVESKFNSEAIKISKKIVKEPGFFSPFFVTSSSGLGKTHLLHAIGNELIKNNFSCYYVEPNLFTKKISNYSKIGGNAISKFIEDLCVYDVLLFDDIQNLGDRSVTLRVLLQILNAFNEKDKQIIIASDKLPRELSGFELRFITRFSSGLTTIISHPSNEDLIKVLQFKLKEGNLSPEKWEREALKFIVRNNSQSIRSIEGAIKRVSFYVEDTQNIKYTYVVVSNIFKELSIDPNELTSQRVINVVSDYYKISKSDIVGKKRKAEIVIVRHMAIWMIRKLLGIPLKEIGRIFGNRDHSTIMSSIKTIDKKMSINNIIKIAAEKIENKIKSVV